MIEARAEPGVRRVEQIMGTPIVVDVRDDVDDGVLDEVFDWFRWVDATFSTYKHNSEISRLDRGELSPAEAHADVLWILDRCAELREETNGYFDVLATGKLDPSALVKGWSVDRAAQLLEGAGANNFAISAGGDMRVSGRPIPRLAWRVGIEHPRDRHDIAAVVEANELAIATSGAYLRGDHVVDPVGGTAPKDVLSVTVTGPDLGTADAYATAAFAMGGARGPGWTARLGRYEALTIRGDETVLTTSRFPAAQTGP